MNTLSPFRKDGARKLTKIPQSRSQPRIGLNTDNSEDTRDIPLSGSFQAPSSALPTPRTFRTHHHSKLLLLNDITDFYDKKQISNAVSSARNLNERVKLIDSILKHRLEIQEIEKQTRFERVAPILSKMGENLRKKVMARAVENNTRRSFVPEALQFASPADSLTSFITETEMVSRTSRKGSIHERRESIFSDTQRDVTILMPQNSKINEPLPPIMLTTADSFRTEPLFDGTLSTKQSGFAPRPRSSLKKQSKILAMLTKNLQKPDRSPKGLVLGPEGSPQNPLSSARSPIKTPRSKDGSVSRDTYGLGSKVLENDIYTYLVKNEKKEDAKKVVTGTGIKEVRQPLMRDIETKAKNKFIEFVNQKKQANYILPNSYVTEKKRTERTKFIPGYCKCVSYQLNEAESSQSKERATQPVYKYVKSSSLIRNAEQEISDDPYGLTYTSKEPIFTANDESFASFTETKLDELYRKTYKINMKIAAANDKLDRTTSKVQIKKWEEYKQRKIKNLLDNSREALKTINRKIHHKGF